MSSLRLGPVGIGMMGRSHARVLDAISGIDLVAVVDAGLKPAREGVCDRRDHRPAFLVPA